MRTRTTLVDRCASDIFKARDYITYIYSICTLMPKVDKIKLQNKIESVVSWQYGLCRHICIMSYNLQGHHYTLYLEIS